VSSKFDLVGVQEVRWDRGGTVGAGDFIYFLWKRKSSIGFILFYLFIYLFKHYRILTAVKRAECVSDRMSYIVLRDCWCSIIVLNVHEPSEEKSDDSKDSFYEELEQVFDHFPIYHMKTLLGDFNAKLEREDIFKATKGSGSLHQDSNGNGVRIVNFATSKNQIVRSMMFLHQRLTIRLITY